MKKINGFPIAMNSSVKVMMVKSELKSEATDIKKGPIPASAFAIPAGYKKKDSPFQEGGPAPACASRTRSSPPTGSRSTSTTPTCAWWTCAGTSTRRGGAVRPTSAGHIPGAVFLDIEEDLSAPGGGRGRPAGPPPLAGARAGRRA